MRLKQRIKEKLKRILKKQSKKDSSVKTDQALPQIISRQSNDLQKKITHISAFNYGNAGDILLPIVLQDVWTHINTKIDWQNQSVYPTVDNAMVEKINQTNGIVIGGGGLFLKDTNANTISGWQWPCSIEMLSKIKVPIVFYAVGYNRFRGQDDFEPYFKDNLTAFAEKAVYIGVRNHGSIEAIKNYIPENLHHKLRFQPCMTTFISEVYPEVTNYEQKEDFIAVNAAFDRSHLRFGEHIGQILNDTAKAIKEASKHYPIKFYSHMPSDEAFLPFLQSYGIKYELVRLNDVTPSKIIEAYAKPRLVIGMRGHAQMIPFGCKTPIVSVVSHNKMQWFLDDIGKTTWGADVLSPTYSQDLTDRILESLHHTQEEISFISIKQKELHNISKLNAKEALNIMKLDN